MNTRDTIRELRPLDIAFDLDGTVAETHRPALELAEVPEETFKTNEFSPREWKDYNHAASNLWHNHSERIEPIPGAAETLTALHDADFVDRIDIVTHRTGQSAGIVGWLEENDAEYDDFVPVPSHGPKGRLNYDVYLDDSPVEELPERSVQLVPARWYNEDVDGVRIKNYNEVRDILGVE